MKYEITTREHYDSLKTHLNYSGMKEILESPAHYQSYLKQERVETKALRVGTLVHLASLQPEIFSNYRPVPDCDRRTTSGKALYAAFLGSLKQNEIAIDGEEYELALSIADAINITKEHLNVDFIKTELMIQSEDAGVPIKSSLDAIGSDGYIYDIKTCEAADARSFMGNVLNYKYYLQAYFYLNIYRKVFEQDLKGFRFIAVEKSPPYASAVFTLGTEFMNRGFEDYERGLKLFKQCSESKNWPDYPKEVQVLDLAPKQPANNTPITFA